MIKTREAIPGLFMGHTVLVSMDRPCWYYAATDPERHAVVSLQFGQTRWPLWVEENSLLHIKQLRHLVTWTWSDCGFLVLTLRDDMEFIYLLIITSIISSSRTCCLSKSFTKFIIIHTFFNNPHCSRSMALLWQQHNHSLLGTFTYPLHRQRTWVICPYAIDVLLVARYAG